MTKYYVYILDDWKGIPRWVGAGSGTRWQDSSKDTDNHQNPAKIDFIKETIAKVGSVPARIIRSGLSREESFALEKEIIKAIGRHPNGPLTNMTDGGQGPTGIEYPANRSEKISAKLKGRPKSAEHRAKLARATKRYLKEHPAELERLRQQASLGGNRVQSEEERAKRRRPREMTPQHIANIRAAAARRASRKGIPKSQETREKMSEGARARWARDRTPRAVKGPDGKFVKNSSPVDQLGGDFAGRTHGNLLAVAIDLVEPRQVDHPDELLG